MSIYKEYFLFIRQQIKDIDFKHIPNDEIEISFNLPYIGKLGCDSVHFKGVKKKLNKQWQQN